VNYVCENEGMAWSCDLFSLYLMMNDISVMCSVKKWVVEVLVVEGRFPVISAWHWTYRTSLIMLLMSFLTFQKLQHIQPRFRDA